MDDWRRRRDPAAADGADRRGGATAIDLHRVREHLLVTESAFWSRLGLGQVSFWLGVADRIIDALAVGGRPARMF